VEYCVSIFAVFQNPRHVGLAWFLYLPLHHKLRPIFHYRPLIFPPFRKLHLYFLCASFTMWLHFSFYIVEEHHPNQKETIQNDE
jgi:hypothetical protein